MSRKQLAKRIIKEEIDLSDLELDDDDYRTRVEQGRSRRAAMPLVQRQAEDKRRRREMRLANKKAGKKLDFREEEAIMRKRDINESSKEQIIIGGNTTMTRRELKEMVRQQIAKRVIKEGNETGKNAMRKQSKKGLLEYADPRHQGFKHEHGPMNSAHARNPHAYEQPYETNKNEKEEICCCKGCRECQGYCSTEPYESCYNCGSPVCGQCQTSHELRCVSGT